MSEPQAIVTGEMASTRLGELLFSLYSQKLTGSVVLAESEATLHCIRVLAGLPQKVRLAEAHDPIGAILIEQRSMDPAMLGEVLGVAEAGGTLVGQTALHMSLVTPDELRRALAEQVLRRTARLFAVATGTFGVYREDFLAGYGGADAPPVDPLPIIAEGVRRCYDPARLDWLLQNLAGAYLSVAPGSSLVGRFRFGREESGVVAAMTEPLTFADIESRSGAPRATVRLVAYCLHVAGALEAATLRPSRAPAPARAVAASPDSPEGRRAMAEDLVARFKDMNYFELLGVQPGASDAEIQRAYVDRARYFHPDRARGELADLRAGLAEFFAQVTVARQTLADPKARERYMAKHGLVAASRPSAAPPPPEAAPPPPPRPSAEPKSDKRLAAEELLATFHEKSYFELLGVQPGASDAEVQKAYVGMVRVYHPDRVMGELADLKPRMADLFARITLAHKTLKDPKTRREYEASLSGGGGDGAQEEVVVQQILDAETTFQKARILLKTGRVEEAEASARQAAEADPAAGQYAGLLAWIEAKRRPAGTDVSDLVARLKVAVKAAPKYEELHFYLAELLNRSGLKQEALREYEATMELNAHNIDAVRMVRHLRRAIDAEREKKKKPSSGLMGFLLKDVGKK